MLIIQDIHIVQGRSELPFEDAYRDELAPRLADCGARLAFFGWAPHGGGQGYEAVALTTVPDGDALLAYQEALAAGALAEVWAGLEGGDHRLVSSLHVAADASPFGHDGDPAPEVDTEAPPTLYRHETIRLSGNIDDALSEITRRHADAAADDLLALAACYTPFFGELAAPEVTIVNRVGSLDTLRDALGDVTTPWSGTLAVSGADCVQTRLLRGATWAPRI